MTSSFSLSASDDEVYCPIVNQDGSICRKRCTGEKKFRSIQEHIRRAHPDNWIPKLPATEASVNLMIRKTLPGHAGHDQLSSPAGQNASERDAYYRHRQPGSATPHMTDEYTTSSSNSSVGQAHAAAALAQLQNIQSERNADDSDGRRIPRASIEWSPVNTSTEVTSDPYSATRHRDTLAPLLGSSPPGRSSTLPPLQRSLGTGGRTRRQSVTKRGREAHDKSKSSRDLAQRLQHSERMWHGNSDRKALSAEPSVDRDRRWLDLIDAAGQAASAAVDLNGERTPVARSPNSTNRSSLPPFQHAHIHAGAYQASPLQRALTPPTYTADATDPVPSVESGESGDNFHMAPHGLSASSPSHMSVQTIQIYCAACQRVSPLKDSYACTECICGLCQTCVEILMAEHGAQRKCPRCATIGGRFKPFQLEIRY
ncbi:hypothetical protein CDD82_215 [Ophiocordyceps australis]|uniref:RING zinc finger-like domain-containing protein n=1 Tax=Ophiocordyceps australis TaxID=1399860 RepID=A0A2C5YPD2_9HYPO|nr:hypothetical protein CDD82_215 [Ophiocordyceps australis]